MKKFDVCQAAKQPNNDKLLNKQRVSAGEAFM